MVDFLRKDNLSLEPELNLSLQAQLERGLSKICSLSKIVFVCVAQIHTCFEKL
jgi:hypothetical protein